MCLYFASIITIRGGRQWGMVMNVSKRILIVEDEQDLARIIKQYLNNIGYEAVCASTYKFSAHS